MHTNIYFPFLTIFVEDQIVSHKSINDFAFKGILEPVDYCAFLFIQNISPFLIGSRPSANSS